MNLLLDTHTFLWFINGDAKLSPKARALIEDPSNQRFLSIASIWEMAIKVSIGKLTLLPSFQEIVPIQLNRNDIAILPITLEHTLIVATLPFHHKDPFDRIIVAQASAESMSLLSADHAFEHYPVHCLW